MRRFAGIILFSLQLFLWSATLLYATTPWLHADGNQIKDPDGNVVILRGIDLIDLGFLEDWHGGAFEMIDRLTDVTDTQGASPGWYPKVLRINITPPDSVSNWPHPFDPDDNDFYDNLLRPVVDYCASKDLYVIIDWHYIANTYDHVASTSEFWTYMAPRFATDSHVIFELFNEPINNTIGSETDNWLSVRDDMQTWIDIVRAFAPNNLILVAGPNWSQAIGPAASYPVSDPVGGNNIAIVSHIYPGHWRNPSWYQNHIETCHAVFPIVMTEWGFSQSGSPDPGDLLHGTISEYGQPLMDYIEGLGISNTAWVASYNWGPPMFYSDWTLRCGEGEMGCFVKDTLYLMRNSDQPGGGGDTTAPVAPNGLVASLVNTDVLLDWDVNSEDDLYGYHVYRSMTSGTAYTKITSLPVFNSDYIDTTAVGGNTYFYVVTAVDSSSNESDVSNEAPVSVPDLGMGTVLRQWWSGISGTSVSNLTSNVNYPDNPSGSEKITSLEGPSGWGDNYGTRIRGYLHPPSSGSYTFWIAGDDNCQLWLSTDGNPTHASLIASVPGWTNSHEWDKYTEQESSTISLTAEQKYYIEVLHKEGTGGDNVAVAWSGPGITQQVIDGAYLSRWFIGLYGDFIIDGTVDILDLAAFMNLWLEDDCITTAGMDLDGNCIIDLYEWSVMSQNWN
jgi:hypothetical protein